MKNISSDKFDQTLKTSELVMAVFTATWCGPCKAMKIVIDNVEDGYAGKVNFIGVDIDAERELRERFNITSIPTLIAFKDGEIINRQTGAMTETAFSEKLDRLLKR